MQVEWVMPGLGTRNDTISRLPAHGYLRSGHTEPVPTGVVPRRKSDPRP